jgi:hypothetical protein
VAITNHTTNALNMPMDGSTVVWTAVPNGNQGDGVAEDWLTAFFQVTGTFGAAGSVQIEGSNDNVNWVKLSPAALTAAGLVAPLAVNERPKWLRPNVTAGDGTTALTITGFLKKLRTGSM